MNKGAAVITVSLLVLVMLVLPAMAISAGHGQRSAGGFGAMAHASPASHARFGAHIGGSRGFGGGHPAHRGFGRQPSFRQPFHHSHGVGRFFPFGAFAAPLVWYGWPSSYGWPYFY